MISKQFMFQSLILILLINANCFCSQILETETDAMKPSVKTVFENNYSDSNTEMKSKTKVERREATESVILAWKQFKAGLSNKIIMNFIQLKETHFLLPEKFWHYKYARKHIKSSNNWYNISELEIIKKKLIYVYYNPSVKFNDEYDKGIHSFKKIDEAYIQKLKTDIELLKEFIIACKNQINESIIFNRFIKRIKSKMEETYTNNLENKINFSLMDQFSSSLVRKILVENKLLHKRLDCIKINKKP